MATYPFEQVSMDIVGPLPKTKKGNKYLLTMVDNFTRYAEAVPLKEQTAEETARAFVELVVTRHGIPERLLTDQGRNFVSKLFKEVCKQLGVKKLQTTAYHPEANGMVERLHKTLTDSVAHFVRRDGRDWDRWIPFAVMAYRNIPHSSTGFSPNYLLLGRELEIYGCRPRPAMLDPEVRAPIEKLHERLEEAHREARERAEKVWAERTRYCNRNRRDRRFQEGDLVYLHVPGVKPGHCPKFHCPWTGPHTVVQVLSRVTYRVRLSTGSEVVVHVNRLKRAHGVEDPESGTKRWAMETPEAEGEGARESLDDGPWEDPMWIWPGPQYDLEEDDDVPHAGCPVVDGEAAECRYPGCPLGGSFRESSPTSVASSSPSAVSSDPEEPEEGEASGSDGNETVIHRDVATPIPPSPLPDGIADAGSHSGGTMDISEDSQTSSEASEWAPQPGTGLVRERSPYNLRSRRAP